MITELLSKIMDAYFSKKTKKYYPEISKEFNLIKDGIVKMKYGSDVSVAGFLPIKSHDFLYNNQLIKDPLIITNHAFLDFDKGEKLSIIAHELGHYDFYCKTPSPECLKRRLLWSTVSYVDRDYFDYLLNNGADIKILEYISKYMHNDKRMARLKKWKLLKELYADNKTIESGRGKELLSMLNKAYKKWNSRLTDKDVLLKRIKNLEEKLEGKVVLEK